MPLNKLASPMCALVCAITLSATPVDVGAKTVKVILLGGQSNMVGRGHSDALPAELKSPQESVLFLWASGADTARNPYVSSELFTLRPGSGGNANEFGPEVTFGRAIAKAYPEELFALIKYAVEGTNLHVHWDPKRPKGFYRLFQRTVDDGLQALKDAGHTPEISGMLWYQGGADAKLDRTAVEYEADLKELIADVRQRYGAELPFFIGRLSASAPLEAEQLAAIRAAQEAVDASDPNTYLVSSDDLSLGANKHLDAEGQMLLGERFAQSYVEAGSAAGESGPASAVPPTDSADNKEKL